MPYQPYTINAYEGLNEDENPASIAPGQLREALNVGRKGNFTGTRPGVVRDAEYDADISGTPVIQGISEFRKQRDANRALVAVAGGEVYTDDTTQLTKVGATITSGAGNLWTFASYQDLMWAAGGASGDSIWSWDGAAGSVTPQLATLGIKPKYVFQKFGTLFLGGFYDGIAAWNNPLVARYADYATDATDAVNWPNSNSIPGLLLGENSGPGSWGNEYATGFGSYQDNKGDFLLFLTNRRILSFRENPNVSSNANRFAQTDAIANGCVSQHAFVDLGFDQGDAIYVSEHGIHSMALSQQFGNRENTFLSWPIRRTWETINRNLLERFSAAYWPEEGIVTIAIATGSNTYLDTILACDIKGAAQITPDTVRWYKWQIGNSIQTNLLATARDSTGVPRIYLGGNDGEIGHFSRDSYSDLSGSYPVAFRDKDEDFQAPTSEKSIGDTNLMAAGAGTYRPLMTYVLDDGLRNGDAASFTVGREGFTLDNAAGNLSGADTMDNAAGNLAGAGALGGNFNLVRDRIGGCGSAYTISHRFTHTGANEPFFIGQITQDVAYQGISDEGGQ